MVLPEYIIGELLIAFSLFLAFTLGWNNSGLTTGNMSNLLTYNLALVVTLAGMFVGYFVEGSKMSHSILGKLIPAQITTTDILVGIAASLFLFLALTIIRIPVSLSNCVVGGFTGMALASGTAINGSVLIVIITSWVVAPFFCAALSVLFYEITTKVEGGMSLSLISWLNRILLLLVVFYVAYALGANNLGLIFSFIRVGEPSIQNIGLSVLEIAVYISLAAGVLLFGKIIAKVVGDKIVGLSQIKTLAAFLGCAIVTWTFTQFSVPVSLTQVVIGGMLGSGSARGPTIVNRTEVLVMIRDWTLVTILSAVMGFGLEFFVRTA